MSPLWEVPEEGMAGLEEFHVQLDDLETELKQILWPVLQDVAQLGSWEWNVEGRLEKGGVRTILKVAVVELNRCAVLPNGTSPVTIEESLVTCCLPEGCEDLWRRAVLWHAATAVVSALEEGIPRAVHHRLWAQVRPRMAQEWLELAARLEIDAPVLDVW